MNTLKQYIDDLKIIDEHCKVGDMYNPFNILQAHIFLKLYELIYGIDDISRTEKLMRIITKTNAPDILGGEMCRRISDDKVLAHTDDDIKMWAQELFGKIDKSKL